MKLKVPYSTTRYTNYIKNETTGGMRFAPLSSFREISAARPDVFSISNP
jgi:hypothetical protein